MQLCVRLLQRSAGRINKAGHSGIESGAAVFRSIDGAQEPGYWSLVAGGCQKER